MKKMLLLMIEKRDSARRFWSNATFSFLLDKFEKRNWELGKKLMKKQNWEDFVTIVNIHFRVMCNVLGDSAKTNSTK